MVESYEVSFKGYKLLIDCDAENDRIVLALEAADGECVAGGIMSLTDEPEIDFNSN